MIPSKLRDRLERLNDGQITYVAQEAARRADRADGPAKVALEGLAAECASLLTVRAQLRMVASILDTRRETVETLERMTRLAGSTGIRMSASRCARLTGGSGGWNEAPAGPRDNAT